MEDLGSIPGLERSPGERNSYPLQHSCLENSIDRGARWTTWGCKELEMTELLMHKMTQRKELKLVQNFEYFIWRHRLEKSLNIKKVKVLVAQLCPPLCDPMDCGLPDSSVHVILQARILDWVAMPFSKRYSKPRDQTHVSCIAGIFFTV